MSREKVKIVLEFNESFNDELEIAFLLDSVAITKRTIDADPVVANGSSGQAIKSLSDKLHDKKNWQKIG